MRPSDHIVERTRPDACSALHRSDPRQHLAFQVLQHRSAAGSLGHSIGDGALLDGIYLEHADGAVPLQGLAA